MNTPKILIIDPDETNSSQTKTLLEEMGHQVEVTATPEEGLNTFYQSLFSIVLCDPKQEGAKGLDVIKKMQNSDPTLVPIIITQKHNQEMAIRASDIDTEYFLRKPYTKSTLKIYITNALQKHQKIEEQRLMIGQLVRTKTQLQATIREQKQHFENLIDAAPLGIISTDTSHHILTFNAQAERLYGYESRHVLGHNFFDLVKHSPHKSPRYVTHHHHKNGKTISVIVYQHPIQNTRDETIGHLYIIEDKRERNLLESQLLQAERLSTLGQLAPRIAHEFKTPLQIITGNSELAIEYVQNQNLEEAQKALNHIPGSVQKLLSLIQQMSNLGKPTQLQNEDVDLNQTLKDLVNTLQPLGAIKYCDIHWDLCPNLPVLHANKEQIEQAFVNLIINAAHAMENSKLRTLSISSRVPKTVEENNDVEVIINDTGPGISPDHIDQIFEPFFTTKPEGKGTGLGLPIVKTIFERHNAICQVDSEINRGTTFTIRFPKAQSAPTLENNQTYIS